LNILNAPNFSTGVPYAFHDPGGASAFTRIAYYLELQQSGSPLQYLWVSMDPFTTDVNKIGVPVAASGAQFQLKLTNLNVVCNVPGVVTGFGLAGGHIEFWPSNYAPANSSAVTFASDLTYDWGDSPTPGQYGSMQIHLDSERQVLFAFNNWNRGLPADLGIGNGIGNDHSDWTFIGNTPSYTVKTLQVFVLPTSGEVGQ